MTDRKTDDVALNMMVEALKILQRDADARMDAKIDQRLGDFQIEADNVNGLDDAVESALNDYQIDADNISDIDRKIERAVDSALESFEVPADNVSGLDDMIEEAVDKKVNRLDANDISGLDDFVDERVRVDNISGLEDAIAKEARLAMEALFRTPAVQEMIAQKVQEALTGIVARLFAAPVAQPVK